MKILAFASVGSPRLRYRDTHFASNAHLPSNPGSAGFKRLKTLSVESLFVSPVESFEAGKHAPCYPLPSGKIAFAPRQKALRNTMALRVQCLAPGDEHRGNVGLGPIEAKSYAPESYAAEVLQGYTTDGR